MTRTNDPKKKKHRVKFSEVNRANDSWTLSSVINQPDPPTCTPSSVINQPDLPTCTEFDASKLPAPKKLHYQFAAAKDNQLHQLMKEVALNNADEVYRKCVDLDVNLETLKVLKVEQFRNDLGLSYGSAHLLCSKLHGVKPESNVAQSDTQIQAIFSELKGMRNAIAEKENEPTKETLPQ